MKASDLMIGNWVDRFGKQVQLEYINPEEIMDFKPIPLTEEWLIKFGFDKDDVEDYIKLIDEYTFLAVDLVDSECHTGVGVEWARVPLLIEHVHQLQNLYISLTGEELKIKE